MSFAHVCFTFLPKKRLNFFKTPENSLQGPFWALLTHYKANTNFPGKAASATFNVSRFLSL